MANQPVIAVRAKVLIAGREMEARVEPGVTGIVFEMELPDARKQLYGEAPKGHELLKAALGSAAFFCVWIRGKSCQIQKGLSCYKPLRLGPSTRRQAQGLKQALGGELVEPTDRATSPWQHILLHKSEGRICWFFTNSGPIAIDASKCSCSAFPA